MFVRTARLTLRPGWPEDAAALTHAIGHEAVARNLAHVPFPYREADARAFLSIAPAEDEFVSLILAHGGGQARLVGGIGIHRQDDGRHELGYWLTPSAWGRGYATEAGHAAVAVARHALGLKRLHAFHFRDNPASGRVLAKLGFRATGERASRHSLARGTAVPAIPQALVLRDEGDGADGGADGGDGPVRLAA